VLKQIFWVSEAGSNRRLGKLHKQDLSESYSSSYIIGVIKSRRMRVSGHEAHVTEKKNTHTHTLFWWGKPERKRPLGRHMHSWEDNTKIKLEEIECEGIMD
jgi:hypothetical protein